MLLKGEGVGEGEKGGVCTLPYSDEKLKSGQRACDFASLHVHQGNKQGSQLQNSMTPQANPDCNEAHVTKREAR